MTEAQPRFRSPPFPYVGLAKALEKAEQLYQAVRHHAAALPTAANAWGTGAKSSATLQSVAALIQYGLLDDEGSGDARKVRLTQLALKIVMDKRPHSPERDAAIREAALRPRTFSEIHEEFGAAEGIDDSLLLHALTAERVQQGRAPYSNQSAADVIRIYKDSVSFAGIVSADKESDRPTDNDPASQPTNALDTPKLGDFVQWIAGGVAQFEAPKRVRAVSDDHAWAFVDGSATGIAIKELEKVSVPPQEQPQSPPILPLPSEDPIVHDRARLEDKDRIKVVWEGRLVHINATVDKEGLAKLRKKLDAMEALLEE